MEYQPLGPEAGFAHMAPRVTKATRAALRERLAREADFPIDYRSAEYAKYVRTPGAVFDAKTGLVIPVTDAMKTREVIDIDSTDPRAA